MVCAGGRCVRASSANDSARPGHFYRARATWPRAVHGAFVDGARRASEEKWSGGPPRGASSHGEIRRPCDPSVRRARRDGAAEDHALRRCVRARASRTRARIPDRDRPNDPTRGSDRSIPSPPIPPVVGIPLPTNDRPRPPAFPSRPRRARRASHRGGTPRRVRALRRPEGREHPARPPDAEEPGVRLRHLRGKVRAERPHSFPAPAPPNGHPSARSPVLPPIARAFDGPLDRSTPPSFETNPPATAPSLI